MEDEVKKIRKGFGKVVFIARKQNVTGKKTPVNETNLGQVLILCWQMWTNLQCTVQNFEVHSPADYD